MIERFRLKKNGFYLITRPEAGHKPVCVQKRVRRTAPNGFECSEAIKRSWQRTDGELAANWQRTSSELRENFERERCANTILGSRLVVL